nr:hypothetical protein [Tanacetum cinerariifolium]
LEFHARFHIQTGAHSTRCTNGKEPSRGRKVTLMIVGYGQDAVALSPECEEGGISQHYSLLNAYITAKAPDFRFKERLKANNAFLGESLAAQLA